MKTVMRVLTIALCASALSFGAIIDDFSTSQGVVTDSVLGPPAGTGTMGNRTISALLTGGVGSMSAELAGGFFLGNAGSLATGQSGASYTGLWDLTSSLASFLMIDVVSTEGYATGTIEFMVRQGANVATLMVATPVAGTYFADLNSFAGILGVNRALVDTVGFTFYHVTTSQDVILDNFATYVPEPGTYAMMAAGLLGLFAIRRKRA